jgi:hypothetical protein
MSSSTPIALKNFSLHDLQLLAKGKPESEIHLAVLMIDSHLDFVGVITRSVDHVIRQMSRNPELRQDHSEDQLTIELVGMLKMLGLGARHDTKVGGHCDIAIDGPNDFLWLGEAKKHRQDYSWLHQGFQQLNTRYLTGQAGQDAGGIIIYSTFDRIDQLMERWREVLSDKEAGITCEAIDPASSSFLSKHIHHRTGRELTVRHVPVSLHFGPKDH